MKAWAAARTVKEWLALIAIVASIVGAGVLTVHRIWLIKLLVAAKQFAKIGDIAFLDTVIIGLVILGLGLAINRRTVKGSIGPANFEASGGE